MERKYYSQSLIGLMLLFAGFNALQAQFVYVGAAHQDSIWGIDTSSWNVTRRIQATAAGYTVLGLKGLAYDPIQHTSYCLLQTTANPLGALLCKLDLPSGICSPIGELNSNFISITVRADGQMLGVVGDTSGALREKMLLIDKSNATSSLALVLGNGDLGEVIAYNQQDDWIYHWSGNATMVLEKFPAQAPFTPISNITIQGIAGGEITGAVCLQDGSFLVANQLGEIRPLLQNGQYGGALCSLPASLRGLMMPAQFRLASTPICIDLPATIELHGIARDTAIYDWGDGTTSRVFPAASASHYYAAQGNYTTRAMLHNPISGLDTIQTSLLRVNQLPPVTLNPGLDTVLCQTDSLLIVASFGGTSRWYKNGALIAGANTNRYIARSSGWYNMTKTNMNGCTDSAATGVSVRFATQMPQPAIAMDTTACPTILFSCGDTNSTQWQWDFGDGGSSGQQNPSYTYASQGSYSIQLTASNGCFSNTVSGTVDIFCTIANAPIGPDQLLLYPNPSAGAINLELQLPLTGMLQLEVFDALGRRQFSKELECQGQLLKDQIALHLPAGNYLFVATLNTDRIHRWLQIDR